MLEELEGAGIDDRREQAQAMGVSLPQIDRLRQALRNEHQANAPRSRQALRPRAPTADIVQLGIRVPASLVARLRSHAAHRGVSAALLAAVALHDWLAAHGTPGPSPLIGKERERLRL
jgi:hypothetical protein